MTKCQARYKTVKVSTRNHWYIKYSFSLDFDSEWTHTVLNTLKWIQHQEDCVNFDLCLFLELPHLTQTAVAPAAIRYYLNINTENEDHPLPDQAYLQVCQSFCQALRYQVTLEACTHVRTHVWLVPRSSDECEYDIFLFYH